MNKKQQVLLALIFYTLNSSGASAQDQCLQRLDLINVPADELSSVKACDRIGYVYAASLSPSINTEPFEGNLGFATEELFYATVRMYIQLRLTGGSAIEVDLYPLLAAADAYMDAVDADGSLDVVRRRAYNAYVLVEYYKSYKKIIEIGKNSSPDRLGILQGSLVELLEGSPFFRREECGMLRKVRYHWRQC